MTSKYKKGFIGLDLTLIVLGIFIAVIAIPYLYVAFAEVQPDLTGMFNESTQNNSRQIIENQFEEYPATYDGAFLFYAIIAWLFLLLTSFWIDSHPIFFVIACIFLIPTFVISIYMSNIYYDLATTEGLTAMRTAFPMSYWYMTHLLEVVIIEAATMVLALYAKWKYG